VSRAPTGGSGVGALALSRRQLLNACGSVALGAVAACAAPGVTSGAGGGEPWDDGTLWDDGTGWT
jgi:hypothetical protein